MTYNSINKIKFSSIAERYDVPRISKGKISELHGSLVDYVTSHFVNTRKYKQKVVDALNILTYSVLENEVPPFDWNSKSPLSTMPDVDMQIVEKSLGVIFLTVDAIDWDIRPTDFIDASELIDKTTLETPSAEQPQPAKTQQINAFNAKPQKSVQQVTSKGETKKEDLYIKSPTYPQFDYSKPWLSRQDGSDRLVIYTSLPEIPTKQNEISVTTDVNKLTEPELINLYPTRFIQTRSSAMYEPVPGIELDEYLGLILPISGYTREEIIDNIIRYPHIYKLQRIVDDEFRSFYNDIEIDGQLFSIDSVWDTLPESKIIPKQSEFIKEYVVRRYILEREKGINHVYPMYGRLDEYLTLFMPLSFYIDRGYSDTTEIARKCVNSRVLFKQSRNPILRRLQLNV